MRPDHGCRVALLGLALLSSCAPKPVAPTAAGPSMCRVSADGGQVSDMVADRGIGGTGAPSQPSQLVDRGIGGTGIVAVITGFASICLADREVALDPAMPVEVDGVQATPASLKAGMVAAVETTAAPGPRAVSIRIRHEVSGPVESDGGSRLVVAGQQVTILPETWGLRAPRVGDWVAVSGVRGTDGVIQATRIDPRLPGLAIVHGRIEGAPGQRRIGTLRLPATGAFGVLPGQPTTAIGRYAPGMLIPDSLKPDILAIDPGAYFGNRIGTLLIEADAFVSGSRMRLGWGRDWPSPNSVPQGLQRRALIEFRRQPDGIFRPMSLRGGVLRSIGMSPGFREGGPFALPTPASRGHYESAPVPNRGIPGESNMSRSGGRNPGGSGLGGPRSQRIGGDAPSGGELPPDGRRPGIGLPPR